MDKYKKTIKGLECCLPMTTKDGFGDCFNCPYNRTPSLEEGITMCCHGLMADALTLLKAQKPAMIEPKRIELADETKAWLDKMDAVDALGNIANICIDWDGYRTADGLGGLINEIWAYARYCADRLLETQKPRVMTLEEAKSTYVIEYRSGKMREVGSTILDLDVDPLNGEYGKIYRVWTSRPTDEQREGMPWT